MKLPLVIAWSRFFCMWAECRADASYTEAIPNRNNTRGWSRQLLFLLFSSASLAIGQTAPPQPGIPGSLHQAARIANFDQALVLATGGDLNSAEIALARNHIHFLGTLERDVETATGLAHIALILRERGNYRSAHAAALRALAILTEAKSSRFGLSSGKRRAEAYEIAGFIYERLLADTTAAKAAFMLAQQEHPEAKGARAGLLRAAEREQQIERLTGGRP